VIKAVFFVHLCLLPVLNAHASHFDGTWSGTYNAQPIPKNGEVVTAEPVIPFEITLREHSGVISGNFVQIEDGKRLSVALKHGRRFHDRACFDIEQPDLDMRWCISVNGTALQGVWSLGPQAGPDLDGMGFGARFFRICGERVSHERRRILR
jgi:hypothetical protein